jgi:TPP-dependent pyruvate/acetoin dehydrogenase alpha subunit
MNHKTAAELIAFEDRIKLLWEAGDLPFLLHLCGGNEGQLLAIFDGIQPGDWIFSTHRSHYHALLAGIPEDRLEAMIVRGDSMFVFDRERNFLTSSVLAGTCAIAAGVAAAIREAGGTERVWCFLGDGAEDEGHFYEAFCYVTGQDLPCHFIIEDNDRSVDTNILDRRGGWRGAPFRMDWPGGHVRRYHYTPTYPHAGSGCAHHILFKPRTP